MHTTAISLQLLYNSNHSSVKTAFANRQILNLYLIKSALALFVSVSGYVC